MVFTFAIGMAVFLNYFKYEKALGGIIQSRIGVVADDISDNTERSLSLGLTLSEIGTLPSLLEREKATDSLITDICIFNDAGDVIYSTNPTLLRTKVNPDWVKLIRAPKVERWTGELPSVYVVGRAIRNNFDLVVGSVAVRYSRSYLQTNVRAMGLNLGKTSLAVLAVFSVLAIIALLFVFYGLQRDLNNVEKPLAALAEDPLSPVTVSEEHVAAFKRSVGEAIHAIEAVDAVVDAKGAGA